MMPRSIAHAGLKMTNEPPNDYRAVTQFQQRSGHSHKHPKVKAWLVRHGRFHIHYTPTYASWLDQVERWFGLITQHAIRRGSFRSLRELVHKIDQDVTHYNLHPRPFVWTATADSILDKLQRLCKLINGTQH